MLGNPNRDQIPKWGLKMTRIVQGLFASCAAAAIMAFIDLQMLKQSFAETKKEVKEQNTELESIKNLNCFMAIREFHGEKIPSIVMKSCFKQ